MSGKVSILIPTYNRVHLIERSIESALGQTYKNIEIILSDNCSTDGTWERIQDYARQDPRIKAWRTESNIGPFENWVHGLKHCQGDYVKILWSDDAIAPEFIQTCVDILQTRPDVGLVFTGVIHHKENKEKVGAFPGQELMSSVQYVAKTMASQGLPVSPGCALVRRKDACFQIIKDSDPRLKEYALRFGAGPDVLFLFESARPYAYVAHVPQYLAHFHGEHEHITGQHQKEVSLAYHLTYQNLLRNPTQPFYHKVKREFAKIKWKQKFARFLKKFGFNRKSSKRLAAK